MVTQKTRDAVEAEQEQLLRALLNLSAPPAGFSAEALAVAASSLWTKRCHTVARCFPHLSASLGSTFKLQFEFYTDRTQPSMVENPLLDGFFFANWLQSRGHHLTDEALIELLAFRLSHKEDGAVRRFHLSWCFLPESGSLALGANLFGRTLMKCFGRA